MNGNVISAQGRILLIGQGIMAFGSLIISSAKIGPDSSQKFAFACAQTSGTGIINANVSDDNELTIQSTNGADGRIINYLVTQFP